MKTNKLSIHLAGLGLLLSLVAQADPQIAYVGDLKLNVGPPHNGTLSGALTVMTDAGKASAVKAHMDAVVFGHQDFTSAEQSLVQITPSANQNQLGLAWKFAGTPHKWYYVFVGNSKDGGANYSGTLYKVPATLPAIETALTSMIPAAPTGWKTEGSANLKKQ